MYRKSYIEVDLNKLESNVKSITNTFKGYEYYFGVIKGNAYGHGEYIAKYITKWGINYLAVSSLEEAIYTRKYNKDTPILCLEPIGLEYMDEIINYNVTICVSNIDYFNELVKIKDKKIKFHLKLNTGMNRLGVNNSCDVKKIYMDSFKSDNLEFEGIFTHLSTSGRYDKLFNYQINKFRELVSDIDLSKIKIVHVGRSATLDFFPKLDFCNGIRVGIMLYGVGSTFPTYRSGLLGYIQKYKYKSFLKNNKLPAPYQEKKISPIQSLSLKSEIIDIQKVRAGDNVGYGYSNIVEKDGYIAIIPLGYADGIFTNYNNLKVKINNKKYSVFGSINMGMISILVDKDVKIGDIVTFINYEDDYKITARKFNVSPYQLLTNLRRELPHVYIKDGKIDKIIEL